MTKVLNELIGDPIDKVRLQSVVDKFSFKAQSQREPGQQDNRSFLRNGKAGDWKLKFNRVSARLFDQYGGNELILLGYESDHSWVERVDE